MSGTFRAYVDKRFNKSSLDTIAAANAIIGEYEADGMSITLRQLHYQFVSRNLYRNTQANYARLGSLISDGRMAGLVSWTAIEDLNRQLMGNRTWRSVEDSLREARKNFRMDLWKDQPCRPEVWIEKQALQGVISDICDELRVDFFATRGYNSQSEQWRAGRRFAARYQRGQRPVVLHLGDHDPSGVDMTRDNRERLALFCGTDVLVCRLALNMDQIEEHNPPPNFAKETDSRFEAYRAQYGDESWELDALDPHLLRGLISDAVAGFRDEGLWEKALAQEAAAKNDLDVIIEENSQ